MGVFGSNYTQGQLDDIVATSQVPYDQEQADRESRRVRVTRNGVWADLGPSGANGGNYGGAANEG